MGIKSSVKRVLAYMPLVAEADFYLRRGGKPPRGFSLEQLEGVIEDWRDQAAPFAEQAQPGKKVLVFATLHYWIEHATLLGLGLAGVGHDVSLAYLPFATWLREVPAYDFRQHRLHAQQVLEKAEPLLKPICLFDLPRGEQLPKDLLQEIRAVSIRDCQYTQQMEEIDRTTELFQMRLTRNLFAAEIMYTWMQENKPDVVIVPNGLIMEFGALYQVGRYLDIPVVSYEFGEQRDKIWFSLNSEVMIQDTDEMWAGRKDQDFSEAQFAKIEELFASRRGAELFQNFYRTWQNLPSEGGEAVREKLGLDDRPLVLVAANVIGDSLTLGRQVFTESMTEWLQKTLHYFAEKEGVQFVVRVHPGEKGLDGPSVADIAHAALPDMPNHIHVIAAEDPINTYDLISIADFGMVYTTTTGMEMAMSGLPVVVIGRTHYRGKGFTHDPADWDHYFEILDRGIADKTTLAMNKEQTRSAWHYAYRFFYDYPRIFPWHLIHFWDHVEEWPLTRVLSEDGLAQFATTFDYLSGQPVPWTELD